MPRAAKERTLRQQRCVRGRLGGSAERQDFMVGVPEFGAWDTVCIEVATSHLVGGEST